MKIVHVVLSRGFAGSERSTAESSNQQCKNHQVWVVVRNDHRKNGKSIVDHLDKSVQIIQVPSKLFTGRALAKEIHRIQPDIIHCHLRRSTRLVSRLKTDAATLSTLHITVNGKHFNKMDGLICNAKWQLADIPSDYSGEVFKANNSLVPHRRLLSDEVKNLRRDLGIQENDYLIGAVGRYHKSKAWDTLIAAFKQVPEFTHAKLLFFGSGSLEQPLKEQAAGDERINFVGFKDNIKDYYQTFDLAACPSRFEPLPRVMLEALDGGAPLIASDAGGCLELIEDYGGTAFAVDDVEELTSKLRILLENPPPKHRPDLTAHYVENANAAMEKFYQRLIENKRKQLKTTA